MERAKTIIFALAALTTLFLISNASALANPSAVYCEEMNKEFGGYDYKIKADANGNYYGICAVDGNEFDGWDFFKGKTGQEYSYCAKKGYEIKTKKNERGEYAACANKNSKQGSGKNALSAGEEKSIEEIMDLKSKLGGTIPSKPVEESAAKEILSAGKPISTYSYADYNYWNWKSPPAGTQYALANYAFSDTTQGWVTSVKDQSTCGSCWSFSTHASVEAKYEIEQNNSRLNPDLSEQNSVSCDHSCYSGCTWPANAGVCCQNGCSGGFLDLALKYMKSSGTPDENCFKYANGEPSCSNRCSDYSSRLWTISDYTTTWPEGSGQTWLTINQTKQWLIDYGPLVSGIYMETSTDPVSNIYRCTSDTTAPNHAVLLVGYNETGNSSTSYWIAKNSWGNWGESGYFKIGFNECNFTYEFDFPITVSAPSNYKPLITLNSPANNLAVSAGIVTFNFTAYTKNSTTYRCDLIINGGILNYTSSAVNNATSKTLTYNLQNGTYNWYTSCWEEGLGIANISAIRTFYVDTTSPYVGFLSPINTSYNNRTQIVNIANSSDAASIWFFNGSANVTYTAPVYVTFPEGSSTIYAYANDSVGNLNQTRVIFTIDTANPAINFTSPAENSGATLNRKNIAVNVTASDSNLANITISLFNSTGAVNSTTAAASPLFLNFTNLADGVYYFNATAYDTAGNMNYTETRNATVEASAPSLAINSPSSNSWNNQGRFNVSINENGNCLYSLDNGRANRTMSSSDNQNFYASNSTLSNGNYNVTYYCNDSAGKLNSSSAVLFNVDIDAPNVSLVSPAEGYSNTGTITIPFEYNTTDNINITQCALIISGSESSTTYNASAINTSATNTISKELSAGSYSWGINCTDAAGNTGNSSTRSLTIESAETPSSGGGGGGTTVTGLTYTASESALESEGGYAKEVKQGDKIEFNVSSAQSSETQNSAKTKHSITIEKVGSNFAVIVIRSEPINLTLNAGQEAKVNLSSPEYYDLYVKLESIINSKANITIKAINEKIALNAGIKSVSAGEQNETAEKNENSAKINEIFRKITINTLYFALGIVVGLAIFAIAYRRFFYSEVPKKFRKN